MTSIIERASDVHVRIVDLQHQVAGDQLQQMLLNCSAKSKSSLGLLNSACSIARALESDGMQVASLSKAVRDSTLKAANALRVAANSMEVSQSEQETITLLASSSVEHGLAAEELLKFLASSVQKSLEMERTKLTPPDISSTVPYVTGQAKIMIKLRSAQERFEFPISVKPASFENGGRDLLSSRSELRNAAETWNREFPHLQEALAAESPEMRVFLVAAATREGAPLEQVTPELLEQIKKEGRLTDFRVHSR